MKTRTIQVYPAAYKLLQRWKRKSKLPMARIASEAIQIAHREWSFTGDVTINNKVKHNKPLETEAAPGRR